jgi:glycosyl transferase family 25
LTISSDITNILEAYFDKILVVSVPRLTARHRLLEQHLQGLSFEYFWGTDKLTLDYNELRSKRIYDEGMAIKLQRSGKPLKLGEIACSLSHRDLYSKIVKEGWEKVLVLEDDVLPRVNDLAALPGALGELPVDWELVYLGYQKHEKVTKSLKVKQYFYKILSRLRLMKWDIGMVKNLLPRPYSHYLKKAGFHDCTHAYAITNKAAEKLLAEQTPVVYRADDLLSASIMKGKLNAFVTEPKFFDQESLHDNAVGSEIQ